MCLCVCVCARARVRVCIRVSVRERSTPKKQDLLYNSQATGICRPSASSNHPVVPAKAGSRLFNKTSPPNLPPAVQSRQINQVQSCRHDKHEDRVHPTSVTNIVSLRLTLTEGIQGVGLWGVGFGCELVCCCFVLCLPWRYRVADQIDYHPVRSGAQLLLGSSSLVASVLTSFRCLTLFNNCCYVMFN